MNYKESKFAIYCDEHIVDTKALAKKLKVTELYIKKNIKKGVTNKVLALAIAYVLQCDVSLIYQQHERVESCWKV